MSTSEKTISYQTKNSYSTLNELTAYTKNVWFVCHGMGYLSRYFLKYFKGLDPEDNYIIAPQAPSKYYQGRKFNHVGANWLTRENTSIETENIMRYFDSIFDSEQNLESKVLIVFGYSQGVSVAMRYVAKRKLQCSQLVMHSGGIPKELKRDDFLFFQGQAKMIFGTEDEYLDLERIESERSRANSLFNNNVEFIPFHGNHEVNIPLIHSLV